MLPVEAIAVERLGYGEMPLGALVKELEKRTSGRLLRLDKKWRILYRQKFSPATLLA
jgi:hypothetical protein